MYKFWCFHVVPLEGLAPAGLIHKMGTMTYMVKVWGKDEIRMQESMEHSIVGIQLKVTLIRSTANFSLAPSLPNTFTPSL